MAWIELAYSQGVWHKVVETELDKLRSEGTLTSYELNEDALGKLQTLPYEEAIMVLKNMYNKPIEEDMSAWIIKECEEMWQKYATPKEKCDYLAAKILVNCSEKAVEAVARKRKPQTSGGASSKAKTQKLSAGASSKAKTKAAGGASSKAKTKAAGGASSKAKTKAAGGAGSKAKTKAAGGASSKAKTQKAAGGAGSKGPEGFHYVRTPDGQTKKVFDPTTEENPIVIDD
jgi:hypothetical protein